MQMIKRRIIALSCILVTIKFYKKKNHLETETAQKKCKLALYKLFIQLFHELKYPIPAINYFK